MSTDLRRVTVSLPPEVVDGLDFIAGRFRVSRSALLGQILGEALPALTTIASAVPEVIDENTDAADVRRRMRGASAEVISAQIQHYLKGDLFDE